MLALGGNLGENSTVIIEVRYKTTNLCFAAAAARDDPDDIKSLSTGLRIETNSSWPNVYINFDLWISGPFFAVLKGHFCNKRGGPIMRMHYPLPVLAGGAPRESQSAYRKYRLTSSRFRYQELPKIAVDIRYFDIRF